MPTRPGSLRLNNVSLGRGHRRGGSEFPAAEAHLQPGVVITEVGKTAVHNAREALDALKNVDLSKGGVPLYVATREGSQFVFLKAAGASNSQPDQSEAPDENPGLFLFHEMASIALVPN